MLKHIKHHPLLWIVLLAAILRFGYFAIIASVNFDDGFYVYDSFGYWKIADNLHQYGVFSQTLKPPLTPDYYRTPLYPLFIYIMELLPGNSILPIIFLQNMMGLLIVFYTYKTAKRLFKNTFVPVLAALFLAIDVPSIVFGNLLLTEMLFSVLLITGLYFVVVYFEKQTIRSLIIGSVLIGLAILTRPIGIFLPLIIGLFMLLKYRNEILKGLVHFSLLLGVVLITVSPWLIRNKTTFDGYFLSVIAEHNLQNFQAATIYAEAAELPLNEARCSLRWDTYNDYENGDVNENPLDYAKFIRNDALNIIQEHKWLFVKNHVKQMVYFFVKPVRSYIDVQLGLKKNKHQQITNQPEIMTQLVQKTSKVTLLAVGFQLFVLGIIYLSSIFGLMFFKQQKMLFYALFFISFLVLFANFNIPDSTDARFRLPFMPLLSILAATGIYFIKQKHIKKPSQN